MAIINGDFETGDTTGWTVATGTGYSYSVQSDVKYSGDYALKFDGSSAPDGNGAVWATLRQPITGVVGDIVSVRLKASGLGSSTLIYFRLEYASNSSTNIVIATISGGDVDWTLYNHTITQSDIDTLTTSINFCVIARLGPSILYVDNASYITQSPVSLTGISRVVPIDQTPIDFIGVMDIKAVSPIDFTGVNDIIGTSHTASLIGNTACSHGVASTFRCDIR